MTNRTDQKRIHFTPSNLREEELLMLLLFSARFAHARYSSRMIDRFLNWGDHGKPKSGKIKGLCQPSCQPSLGGFSVLRHPNHLLFAGVNNRNVIITYAAPDQGSRDFFWHIDGIFCTVCTSIFTRELLGCLLGISHSGRNPCGGNKCKITLMT